ncbi:hypothetical protein SKAU_G00091290 [Synaphobranchus kaupii]|uniref:Uncharacterized protein n=1 Tax=Synaphobranchus kaupii TaxID=118154 RepID=A0A9Q1FWR2_SYNKA|nr:hypothetical protein SKAU_G00091290 [Synaphobranchus kaupii]
MLKARLAKWRRLNTGNELRPPHVRSCIAFVSALREVPASQVSAKPQWKLLFWHEDRAQVLQNMRTKARQVSASELSRSSC